jgi:hypothetical protein
VGAVAGGLITFGLQLQAQRREARTRERDEHTRRVSAAHGFLFKLFKLHGRFVAISDHIESSFQSALDRQFKGEPWQFVLPLATSPPHVSFTTEEMALLLAIGEDDLFNGSLTLDDLHNTVADLVDLHRRKRDELSRGIPPQAMSGSTGSASLTGTEALPFRPLMIETNDLILGLREFAKRGAQDGARLIKLAHEAFQQKLRMNYRLVGAA